MDIVSRLKLFLKQNGIANSQFADTCEIARPTLSQLLNGRNKKVSDEIISKIHHAYPALNIMWLMFGDGDMLLPNAAPPYPARNEFGNPASENTLFGNSDDEFSNNAATSAKPSISFGDSDDDFRRPSATTSPSAGNAGAMAAAIQTMMRAGSGTTATAAPAAGNPAGKYVTSIMVFYSDNSFETFLPAQG